MIGVQDTQVKTMGFERKSSLLEHARIIKLIKRLDGSRLLRLDDTSTIRVPNLASVPTRSAPVPAQASTFVPLIDGGSDSDTDPCDDEEEAQGDGKEPIIMELIRAGWTYGRIVAHLGTSSARISRIKHKMEDTTFGV
jgi:hypothetical protein